MKSEANDILELTHADRLNYIAMVRAVLDVNDPTAYRITVRTGRKERLRQRCRVTLNRKNNLLVEQNHSCKYCGSVFCEENRPTIEHVIPYKYGSRINFNVILLCETCNRGMSYESHEKIIERIESHYGPIDHSMVKEIQIEDY